MRAVVQRVKSSNVKIDNKIISETNKGLTVLLGVWEDDNLKDIDYLVEKITKLRIFEDKDGKMNLSLLDVEGELLVVSQFTLYGDCRKGRRPSFVKAAKANKAEEYYNTFVQKCLDLGIITKTGVFQAEMIVNIENDGPVTIILDSEKKI